MLANQLDDFIFIEFCFVQTNVILVVQSKRYYKSSEVLTFSQREAEISIIQVPGVDVVAVWSCSVPQLNKEITIISHVIFYLKRYSTSFHGVHSYLL